jgi:hypothetical protein
MPHFINKNSKSTLAKEAAYLLVDTMFNHPFQRDLTALYIFHFLRAKFGYR